MGNQNKTIAFQKSNELLGRTLCKISQDGNQIEFIEVEIFGYLLKNPSKQLKSVIVTGKSGAGKSMIIQQIASKFLSKPVCLFPSYSKQDQGTQGIRYFITQLDNKTDLIFFDCEGYDFYISQDNNINIEYATKLYLLVSQLARLSTVTLYVSKDSRIDYSLIKFLQAVNQDEKSNEAEYYFKKKGILSNLIQIKNCQESFIRQKSDPIFHKQYYLPYLNKSEENQIVTSKDCNDTIEQIAQYIRTAEFSSIHKETESLSKNQTCKNFYEALCASFQKMACRGVQFNLQSYYKNYIQIKFDQVNEEFQQETKEKIENYVENVSQDNYISFFIIQIMLEIISRQQINQFIEKIQMLREEWNNKFVEEMNQFPKIENPSEQIQISELVNQYTQMEELQPTQLKKYEEYKKNRSILLRDVSNLEEYKKNQSALMCFGGYNVELSCYKNQDNNLKQKMKQRLKLNFLYLRLNRSNSDDMMHNKKILQDTIKDSVGENLYNETLSRYDSNQIDYMIPMFYFNIITKTLKIKNYQRINKDKNIKELLRHISQLVEGKDEGILKNIIFEILNTEIDKQEKQKFKNSEIIQIFDCNLFQFKDSKYNKQVKYFLNYNTINSAESLKEFTELASCLLLLKFGWSDLFSQFLFQITFPKQFYQSYCFKKNELMEYFDFQLTLLDQKKYIQKVQKKQRQLEFLSMMGQLLSEDKSRIN